MDKSADAKDGTMALPNKNRFFNKNIFAQSRLARNNGGERKTLRNLNNKHKKRFII